MTPSAPAWTKSAARPNILCLVSEDCPPRLSAYGDRTARTPNLDRLAAEGIVFENAFCTAPVCAPSRFAILTGHHAESVGPAHHMSANAHLPPEIGTYPDLMGKAGYYCTNAAKTHYNCDVDPLLIWDECSPEAHWRNRPDERPFLAVFNCLETHESCLHRPIEGSVSPQDVRLPAYLPDTPALREDLARYYNHIEEMDRFMGRRLAELEADGLAEDTIVLYFSDHASPLPRSKRFCYDDGLKVPLIARIPEKWRHLAPSGPGSRIAAPVSLVDLPATFLSLAGAPRQTPGQAFLGADRAPRRFAFSARDRMDEFYDMVRTVRSEGYRYIRNYAPHRIWGQHYAFAWLAHGYQDYERLHLEGRLEPLQERFWQTKPAEELYDNRTDPDSTLNLINDPAHAAALAELRAALDAHLIETHDNGFIPEASPAESYEASRRQETYPIERVIGLANRAIARDPANVPDLAAALDDANAIIRYWGAQGLLMLAAAGHALPGTSPGASLDILGVLAGETDIHTRIVLAETAGHQGHVEAAITELTAIVRDKTNPRIRLQALNGLNWLPLRPDLSLAVIILAADDDDEYVRGGAEYLRLRLTGQYQPSARVFDLERFQRANAGARHAAPVG